MAPTPAEIVTATTSMRPGEGAMGMRMVSIMASEVITEPLGADGSGVWHTVDRAPMDKRKPGPPHGWTCSSQPSRWHPEPHWWPYNWLGTDAHPVGLTWSAVCHYASLVGSFIIPSSNTHSLSSTSPRSSARPRDMATHNTLSLPQEAYGTA